MKPAAAICILLALASCAGTPQPRRILHVSLYPYIPDAAAAALSLKQGFERLHPDVIVDVTLNANYYSLRPEDRGVLYEDADIHEIDNVFLRDAIDRARLQPPGPALAPAIAAATPLARQAATVAGHAWGVPHWLCADFLLYRADLTGIDHADTLADLQAALGPTHGLLLNLKGDGQLGELYLTALLARTGSTPERVLANLSPDPDPAILDRLRRLLAIAPPGLGRIAAYGDAGGFYARQFARRVGGAFVGYSETTHDVLDETAQACRIEDRCVTADQLRVAPLPLVDHRIRPTVWVDLFAIDARVHGRTLDDARAFIAYAVSLPAYRDLLVPAPGGIPRYLLPATNAAFDDPAIRQAAPLYPAFRAIIDQGVVVTAPHLNATLHDVATRIDAALPQAH